MPAASRGLMSVGWMAAVALVLAVEKLVPHPRWATGSVTALLALAAVAVAIG